MRFFTKQEDKFLKENYLTIPAKRMAKMLGRTEGTARQRMKILKIVIPADVIQKFKKDSQFKPGHISANKGEKMPDHVYNVAKKTMFKKGSLPHNTKKDGVIVLRKETMRSGIVRMYKWVRISKCNWRMLHVVKWENKHGKVPKGYIVVFKDKNTMNLSIKNLELITKKENMMRNTIHNLPPELSKTIRVLSSFKRKIDQHEKQTF